MRKGSGKRGGALTAALHTTGVGSTQPAGQGEAPEALGACGDAEQSLGGSLRGGEQGRSQSGAGYLSKSPTTTTLALQATLGGLGPRSRVR